MHLSVWFSVKMDFCVFHRKTLTYHHFSYTIENNNFEVIALSDLVEKMYGTQSKTLVLHTGFHHQCQIKSNQQHSFEWISHLWRTFKAWT